MANAIHLVFLIAFVAAVLALIAAVFTPRRELKDNTADIASAPLSAD